MWSKFEVQMDFVTMLCGSVPANPELIKNWLESRMPQHKPPDSKSIAEVAEEVINSTPDLEPEYAMLTFQRQEGGLVVRMSTLRSHWKDCARTLSSLYVGKLDDERSFSQKVLHAVYYPPETYWLPILSQTDDQPITKPSGHKEKAVHFNVPGQGQRSALKRFEYIEGARLRFIIQVLTPPARERTITVTNKETGAKTKELKQFPSRPVVPQEDLESLFQYAGVHGYAGERSDGEGRYVATIRPIES